MLDAHSNEVGGALQNAIFAQVVRECGVELSATK
jgi:hypothetical protein